MMSTYMTLVIIFYLPSIITIPIIIYRNARFNSNNNNSIISNFSSIQSQHICICKCFKNSMCATAMYNDYYQYCLLYFIQIQNEQLQILTIDRNSTVISLRNINFSIPSTAVSPQVDTITSSSNTLNTMVATMTDTTIAPMTTAVATCTTLITFDDIPNQTNTSGIIPNNYKNLNWINVEFITALTMPINSGYMVGVRTQPFVMHNPTGGNITITTVNNTRFSFDSLYLTSAWRDYLTVTMKTIKDGSVTSTGLYKIMVVHPTYIFCSFCTNIDTIILQAGGGIPHSNVIQNGTQFIIDNLCISFEH